MVPTVVVRPVAGLSFFWLVPMKGQMSETAVTPVLDQEPELRPSTRERLGIAAFVIIAVVATAAGVVLHVWGAVQLIDKL